MRGLSDIFRSPGEMDPRKTAFVVICEDTSGSMAEDNKLPEAQRSLHQFLDTVNFDTFDVALVKFPEGWQSAGVACKFGTDPDQLKHTIDRFSPVWNGTPIYDTLKLSASLLKRKTGRRVIVLATDGQPTDFTPSEILNFSKQLKETGIRIITIAIGKDADRNFLRRLASDREDFHEAEYSSQLTDIYQEIATELMPARD